MLPVPGGGFEQAYNAQAAVDTTRYTMWALSSTSLLEDHRVTYLITLVMKSGV
jgi:hypothetical protein